jgi:peroxiredoxin
MARFLSISTLAFVILAASLLQTTGAKEKEKLKDFIAKGKLTKDDPRDQQRGGPTQVHVVSMKAGKTYNILMVSTDFDSYLRLLDPKGNQLEEDDDSGGDLNSLIVFNCTKDGDYKIVCTTFGPNMTGNYTLTVKTTGAVQQPSTAHSRMIGKSAPDFSADFAVNGKPARLKDLQGKVVLLYFWEVRSSSSEAMLPRLAGWNKAHKDKGLAVVGVTFYTSDIDQKLAFDKETGRVITADKANHKTDQTLMTEFAEHHKINHLLVALPKDEALSVFDEYCVNGLPQVVLIDRKGAVRMIDINGEKGSTQVEAELKKLLAEK